MMKTAPISALLLALPFCAPLQTPLRAQMHKVEKADTATRAVAVYEYSGDLQHPTAARLIPVSLFVGGHFEDAGIYLARPIPFALENGLRYDLQRTGIRTAFLDLAYAKNFNTKGSAAAATTPFDDGWFGYGHYKALPAPSTAKAKPNCGNARVVQEPDAADRPHFGNKTAAQAGAGNSPTLARKGQPAPDPCRDGEPELAEKITLDDTPADKNTPNPERPTLHRSPETTANNTGSTDKSAKADKKASKPPNATITAPSAPTDDPDRPTIHRREVSDGDDRNGVPPDPLEVASRPAKKPAADAPVPAKADQTNDTQATEATINGADTMTGGPALRRGRVAAAPADLPSVTPRSTLIAAANAAPGTQRPALDSIVAVSDAKDRPTHDFTYHFAADTDRATALKTLETMALAVLANPALATDADTTAKPTKTARTLAPARPASGTLRPRAPHVRVPIASANSSLADEQMTALQLYFGAPVTYVFTARMTAASAAADRYVTVVAQTDTEGKLAVAMRSVTDSTHLDTTPRYRLIDAVDADGTNRASLLMELRRSHTRQFALYRLLGNKPDQIFVSGTTLL